MEPPDQDRDAKTIEVEARYASFDRLAAFAEGSVGDWPRSDALRLVLVLEELFTNSIGHGYRGESGSPVRLRLDRNGEELLACYEDEAPGFDLRASVAPPAGGAPAQLGGIGLWLVRHYIRDCRHERNGGVNRIWFRMSPAASPLV